jgi:hypothetical protein
MLQIRNPHIKTRHKFTIRMSEIQNRREPCLAGRTLVSRILSFEHSILFRISCLVLRIFPVYLCQSVQSVSQVLIFNVYDFFRMQSL